MPNLAQNQVLQIQADGLDFGVCTDLEPDLGFQAEIKPQIPRRPTTRKQKTNPTGKIYFGITYGFAVFLTCKSLSTFLNVVLMLELKKI